MFKVLFIAVACMFAIIIFYGTLAKLIESTATQNTYQESGQ
jgi:hypothetical protein